MTPARSPRRPTDDAWTQILANAERQLAAARDAFALADPAGNAKPVAAAAVIAAIGFADAITVRRGGVVNAQQHDRLPDLLRALLQAAAEPTQLTRLGRILSRKNAAQYGAVTWTYAEAADYLEQVERFATWARTHLRLSDR